MNRELVKQLIEQGVALPATTQSEATVQMTEMLVTMVVEQCIATIQSKITQYDTFSDTPQYERSMEHIEDIKERFEL